MCIVIHSFIGSLLDKNYMLDPEEYYSVYIYCMYDLVHYYVYGLKLWLARCLI